ncbi:hypothetical protein ACQKPX_13780 [Photobacterium sp. DNB23_23_1]|uniref:Uncharacterized protein n=1 Tax=Photobacterium pectinilyticum TaxID=2906793 RepID=A0ABT1N6G3_9GAMM|nr:hypothetical protein [Photobacterium sp. ZSDE20]MCQ1060343.1 hypothetical protein [Photobacterium sp. ZSDE20]MDD1827666.1 hypothetical protein [Photobacterium sp. ZSDE20]
MKENTNKHHCGSRGGSRPGCGRKPGVKTRPVRLPEWLLDALEDIDDPRHCIVKACIEHYGIEPPRQKDSHD